ncbi:tripartite tricarboxylate transporter substrate binding protein [Roseomonas sp. GC11]|uniref:Bug family tripartite tricarboxylate transporter substrate binding protein n=1 Tax=Roseomonas sp. GC11 TaxID=2950546 RepID=UPI002109B910|nr:tripartite tricarboxylate transporter substrate binding protein [Roseomonas sp. GC11]MCQ4159286.1 tripartite tricarboxylate transporter substrate binding protein [Roseomonas sp. GC11]
MLTRRSLGPLALASASLALPRATRAQEEWSARTVTAVVPWPAGGPTDAFARLLCNRLSGDLGRNFVVENRGGANGTIGMTSAARARPDGATVIIAPNSTYAVAPHLYPVNYDAERAFVGVGLLVSSPLFMLVPRNSPVTSVADYVALAKKDNKGLNYANAGVGATSHLATEMFMQMAGISVTEVGYRGGGPAVQAVLAGEAGMFFMPAAAVMAYIQSGEFRALAATTRARSPLAPEVPTFQELGFPGFEVVEHVAMLAPAGTPEPILRRLNAACAAALRAPEMQPRLQSMAVTVEAQPIEAWPAYARAESDKWRVFLKERNIRIQ